MKDGWGGIRHKSLLFSGSIRHKLLVPLTHIPVVKAVIDQHPYHSNERVHIVLSGIQSIVYVLTTPNTPPFLYSSLIEIITIPLFMKRFPRGIHSSQKVGIRHNSVPPNN